MFEAIEKFSVVKTLQAIADANVVLLLIDATEGVSDQDAHIAGYILESGRAVVVAINKWDATDDYQRQMLERSVESRLSFLKFAPVHHISALKRAGLSTLWKSLLQAQASATVKMRTFSDTSRTTPPRGRFARTPPEGNPPPRCDRAGFDGTLGLP